MNAASQWRHALAAQIAPLYAANPHVAAVIVGGSTARGHADRYSDIELGVFWHQPPTDAERQAAADRINSDWRYLYPFDEAEQVWSDAFIVGRDGENRPKSGVHLEIIHYTTDFIQQTLDAVLLGYDPDLLKQNLVAGVLNGKPLHNADLIDVWQARAATYPDGLKLAVVRRHAQIDHFWRWQMWLERSNNLTMLYDAFAQVQKKLLQVLLALNGVYYFGFKWLNVVDTHLIIKPEAFVSRLAQLYVMPPAQGAVLLTELVEETYDLIENELPELDVDWLRSVFRFQRPEWRYAPPNLDVV
ncbi:MAG: nucleotidyltransferase domain-containing protein [Anaerolineae bacterium]|nr:nucleotidyltransferase domain-containing protein [Anaerolineae bacterium]MCO5203605.1 nucleotidyltransferase domain-containing protein [Anaerolineae bacterium]